MKGSDVKAKRKALGLTQAQFASRLGLSRDYVGQIERGVAPVEPRTALAIEGMRPPRLDRTPQLTDPMERLIEEALIDAGIPFLAEFSDGTGHRLDFHLPVQDVAIEVKRFYSPRSDAQLKRADNVILVQGEKAVRAMAAMIRGGDASVAQPPEDGTS